jgi:hypothetical protein
MKHASLCSSIVQGGGKRRADGISDHSMEYLAARLKKQGFKE